MNDPINSLYIKFYLMLRQVFNTHKKVMEILQICHDYCNNLEKIPRGAPLFILAITGGPRRGELRVSSLDDYEYRKEKSQTEQLYAQPVHQKIKIVSTFWNLQGLFDNSGSGHNLLLCIPSGQKFPTIAAFQELIDVLQSSFSQIKQDKILHSVIEYELLQTHNAIELFGELRTQFENPTQPHCTPTEQYETIVRKYLQKLAFTVSATTTVDAQLGPNSVIESKKSTSVTHPNQLHQKTTTV